MSIMIRFKDWLISLRGAVWLVWATSFCPVQFCYECNAPFWTWRPWTVSCCSPECELAEMEGESILADILEDDEDDL